jgi:hypothetical protein
MVLIVTQRDGSINVSINEENLVIPYTIEGNTSADPTSAVDDREGQGTYQRRRKISTINNGFLRYTIS